MDLDSIVLSEISQIGKGKYCMISLTCGTKKKKTKGTKTKQNRLIETETKGMVSRREEDGGRVKR